MSSNTLGSTPFFTPTQIAGCGLWLDGADRNTLTFNGANVTRWQDKSGKGFVATNSGTVTITSFNGQTVLNMPQARMIISSFNQRVYSTTFLVLNAQAANFIMALGNYNSYIYVKNDDLYYFNPSPANIQFTDAVNARGVAVVPSNAYFIFSIGYGGGTSPSVYNVNGTARTAIVTGGAAAIAVDSTLTNTLYINGTQNGSSETVRFCELLIYNAALTQTEAQQVEGYLAWKWGLQANLPATHPYKNSPFNVPVPRSILLPQTLAPSATPFTFLNPLSISGLRYWYDASDPTVVQSSGTTLTSIQNKGILSQFSLSSNLGTAVTGTNTVNGLNVVRLTSGTRLVYTGDYTLANPRTHMIVSRPLVNTTSSNVGFLWQNVGFNADDYFGIGGNTLVEVSQGLVVVFQSVSLGANLSNQTSIFGARCVSAASNIASLNGSQLSLTTSDIPAYTNPAGGSPFYMNADTNSAQDLCEFMSWNRALTNQEFQRAEGYLAWKWGLQGKLPSNHPFKNAPPGLPVPSVPPLRQLTGGGFIPTQIAGCALWLDAADRNTITFSGSSITQWRDKSTTNTTALTSNGASANPILFQNGGIYINNNSSQTYNASTYSMLAIQSNIMTTSDFTIVIVVNNPTNDTSALFSDPRAAGTSETRSQLNHGFLFEVSTGGSGRFTNPTTAAGSGSRILIATSVPAQSQFFNNGSLTGSNTTAITTYSTDAGGLPTLGGYRNTETGGTDNSWFTGTMFEVIFYTVALTTQQRQQVEGYLAWKWGLVGNLPNNHPYKKWPPPS